MILPSVNRQHHFLGRCKFLEAGRHYFGNFLELYPTLSWYPPGDNNKRRFQETLGILGWCIAPAFELEIIVDQGFSTFWDSRTPISGLYPSVYLQIIIETP